MDRRSDAERIFRGLISEDVAASLDDGLLSAAAADSARPAGLLNGVSATPGYWDTGESALKDTVAALAESVSGSGSSRNVSYVTTPAVLARARILAPDVVAAITSSFPVL